ncbi:hypothetical protein AMTRI_Chr02g223120 [Amborella trichopoda]
MGWVHWYLNPYLRIFGFIMRVLNPTCRSNVWTHTQPFPGFGPLPALLKNLRIHYESFEPYRWVQCVDSYPAVPGVRSIASPNFGRVMEGRYVFPTFFLSFCYNFLTS